MKKAMLILILTCAWVVSWAQVNFVKNPGLEDYYSCPDYLNRINYCKNWSIPGDSTSTDLYCLEYYNMCGNAYADPVNHIPDNTYFYGYPHTGNGMAGSILFYDKTLPPPYPSPPLPFNIRDNLVGRLYKHLTSGQTYCIRFWINLSRVSGYGINKIGAYLDDGAINSLPDSLGKEITTLKPQVFTNEILSDTSVWQKIEGSFVADGHESYISIGNFFPNDSVSKVVTDYYHLSTQYSYYLIDDVSVIPIDLNADAGKDAWVEKGKKVQIGRVGDTTTLGLDCKWFYKGALIDSGAIISVNASAIVGAVDTYAVVQTICGLVKMDTVLVRTVPTGANEFSLDNSFIVYPNPSSGSITIVSVKNEHEMISAKIYDLLGRLILQKNIFFQNNHSSLDMNIAAGSYFLELVADDGNSHRQRILIN